MPLHSSIFLAFDEGSSVVDVVVWLVAGLFWVIAQIHAAKKKQEKKARSAQEPRPPAAAGGGGESPAPAELAEIFKRLGANIPGTPEPPRTEPLPASTHPPVRRPPPPAAKRTAAARVHPEVARRLAQARLEAELAAKLAEAERVAVNAIVPGVQSRAGESRAFDTATRHTGAILPRLYAMSMRLAPLPTLPMPGLDRSHHAGKKWRPPLHSRREIRDALIAQAFLQPARSAAR